MAHPWLFARCKEIEKEPYGYLDLWPRGHGKSTLGTFGKTIQDILASHGSDPLPEWAQMTGGIEPCFAIFSANSSLATNLVKMIRDEFEYNVTLKQLFPDIVWDNPAKEAPAGDWNMDRFSLKRKNSSSIASTLEGHPILHIPAGKRFNCMIFDDCVKEENVNTPEQIEITKTMWASAQNLGMGGDLITLRRHYGTYYHYNDLYCHLEEIGAVKVRKYTATEDGTTTGKLIYLSEDKWKEKIRDLDSYTLSCQYLLNPNATSLQNFKYEWLRYAEYNPEIPGNIYITVDPASAKKKDSDYTVMMVIACCSDRNYYIVDMIRDRLSLTEKTDKLFKLVTKWRPITVGYEKYGMQSDIEHIRFQMDKLNFHFNIIELNEKLLKQSRIARLEPDFRNGRILLPPKFDYFAVDGKYVDLTRSFIHEEYLQFPTSKHDDMLDALAMIKNPDLGVVFPLTEDSRNEYRYEYQAGNKITGY